MNDQTARPSAAATTSQRSVFVADAPVCDPADPAAALFAELLVHARAETPLSLAVVGPAGSGKSSFLSSALARADALAQAAGGAKDGPFVARTLSARVDLSALPDDASPADVAATLSRALQRALRTAGGAWAKAAESAGAAGGDPQLDARAAADAYDETRRRAEAESRDLDSLRGLRARLSDALLFETPGSKVDSYARGARSRIDATLRRFGFAEADTTVSYKQLVGEVAELGGGARAAPTLARAVWGFRSQRRLLTMAAIWFLLSIGLGMSWDSQTSWGPQLREQGQFATTLANALLSQRWLATLHDLAFWAGVLTVALNLWRAWRFTQPLTRGAALLRDEVAERGAALDQQIAAAAQRVEGLRGDADAARRAAEDAAARAARAQAARAPLADLAADHPDERFLEALPQAFAAQSALNPSAPVRLVVGLDGVDQLPPDAALRALTVARRLLGAPGLATLAALDAGRLAAAAGPDAAQRRARFDRLFQATWRLDAGSPADQEKGVATLLGAAPAEPLAAPDAARSLLDEPLTTIETELLHRVAPLAGGQPRALKRLLNLYRLARQTTAERAALALMLASELGGWADPVAVNTLVADARDEAQADPRVVSAVRAARAARPSGGMTAAELTAARRLARRFVALDA